MSPSSPSDGGSATALTPADRRSRLDRAAAVVFRAAALFGIIALFAAGLVTVADIVLRVFGGAVPGAVDLVQLLILSAAFAAIPFAFFRDAHVSVDLLTQALPARVQAALALLTALGALALMALILWYGWRSAQMQMRFGDVSQNLGIPMIWYWAPLLLGSALSIVACLFAVRRALASLASGRA